MTDIIPFVLLSEFRGGELNKTVFDPQKDSVVYRLMGEYLLMKWIWL